VERDGATTLGTDAAAQGAGVGRGRSPPMIGLVRAEAGGAVCWGISHISAIAAAGCFEARPREWWGGQRSTGLATA
jgi:hypothetical protein